MIYFFTQIKKLKEKNKAKNIEVLKDEYNIILLCLIGTACRVSMSMMYFFNTPLSAKII